MILIADGGATKCDWVLLDQNKNEILKANTIGFNPNVIKHELILEELLKNGDLLPIEEDLTAAAYSAYQGTPAIVCILGTGSNSCYFDGKIIHRELPSLGHLLSDEGSGANLGKNLLRDRFMK